MNLQKKNNLKYLVLKTPGGSVDAGNDLIQFLKSIKKDIQTITIQSCSMGFHIVQELGKRLIVDNSVMMNHRKMIVNTTIQFPIIENSYFDLAIKRFKIMDEKIAQRMGISYDQWMKLIEKDFYIYSGENAVNYRAADEVIKIKCSDVIFANGHCPY